MATLCPECGKDPHSGSLKPPFWARRTGLPLYAALVLTAACILMAVRNVEHNKDASSTTPASRGPALVTAAQIRAAAAGDDQLARRVARAVLAYDEYPWNDPACRLYARAIAGPGLRTAGIDLGWPIRWLSINRGVEYSDLAAGVPSSTITLSTTRRHSYWHGPSAFWNFGWTAGLIHYTVSAYLGALSLSVGLMIALWFVISPKLSRIRVRTTRRSAIVAFGFVLMATLWAPHSKEYYFLQPPRIISAFTSPPPGGVALVDARSMAASPQGRTALASALTDSLENEAPDANVIVVRAMPGSVSTDRTSLGWPTTWLVTYTQRLQSPIPARPDFASRSFRWNPHNVQWRETDSSDTARAVSLGLEGIAATLALILVPCFTPAALWLLFCGRYLRRWQRENRCFHCGYELGPGINDPDGIG